MGNISLWNFKNWLHLNLTVEWQSRHTHKSPGWAKTSVFICIFICFFLFIHTHISPGWAKKQLLFVISVFICIHLFLSVLSFYLLLSVVICFYLFLSVFICVVVCFICFNCEALYYHIAPDRIWRFKVLGIDLVHLWILAHVRHIDCHLQLSKPTTSLEAAWAGWGCEGLPRKGKDFKKLRRGGCRWWWRWPWQHGWGLPRDHWDSFPEHQPQPHICRYIWFDHQSLDKTLTPVPGLVFGTFDGVLKCGKLTNMRLGVKCSLCLLPQAFQGLKFSIDPNLGSKKIQSSTSGKGVNNSDSVKIQNLSWNVERGRLVDCVWGGQIWRHTYLVHPWYLIMEGPIQHLNLWWWFEQTG